MRNSNFEKHLEELEKAKGQWQQSEWVLNLLRTQSAKPIKDPTDEEILTWYCNSQKS